MPGTVPDTHTHATHTHTSPDTMSDTHTHARHLHTTPVHAPEFVCIYTNF